MTWMGVYIEWNDKGWRFDIHDHLIDEEGLRPLSDRQKLIWFGDFEKDGDGCKQKELCTKMRTKSAMYCYNRSPNPYWTRIRASDWRVVEEVP
jgi:hypothetical protein